MAEKINCVLCKYYFITWDAAKPMGCRYFGFKSFEMPSETVRASSGEACKMFTPKKI